MSPKSTAADPDPGSKLQDQAFPHSALAQYQAHGPRTSNPSPTGRITRVQQPIDHTGLKTNTQVLTYCGLMIMICPFGMRTNCCPGCCCGNCCTPGYCMKPGWPGCMGGPCWGKPICCWYIGWGKETGGFQLSLISVAESS